MLDVPSMEGLGGSWFIEGDQISIGVEDSELMVPPGGFGKRGIGVNYSVTLALSEQSFDSLDADSAPCCFSYSSISACPKVNADRTTRHNAVASLNCMNLHEAKLGT